MRSKLKVIYDLVRIDRNPFRTITVDEEIAGLVEENQEEQTGSDLFNHEHDEDINPEVAHSHGQHQHGHSHHHVESGIGSGADSVS